MSMATLPPSTPTPLTAPEATRSWPLCGSAIAASRCSTSSFVGWVMGMMRETRMLIVAERAMCRMRTRADAQDKRRDLHGDGALDKLGGLSFSRAQAPAVALPEANFSCFLSTLGQHLAAQVLCPAARTAAAQRVQ